METIEPLTGAPPGDSRSQILGSAIKVFSQRGFGGTRLREIAEQAGVSHAMIKYYFGSKDELWRAAVDFLFERQERELHEILEHPQGEEMVRLMIEQMIRYNARYPEHARMMIQACLSGGPRLDWIIAHLRRVYRLYYADDEDEDEDGKQVLDDNTIGMHYLIYGACHTIFTLENEARAVFGIDVTSEDFIDRFVQLAIQVLSDPALQVLKALSSGASDNTLVPSLGTPTVHSQESDGMLELRIVIPKLPRVDT